MHITDPIEFLELFHMFRDKYPVKTSFKLLFGDCTIKVSVNQKEILDELIAYFGPFVTNTPQYQIEITVHQAESPTFAFPFTAKQPDPGKTKIKEEYIDLNGGRVVRKRLTGMVFLFGRGQNLAIGPCLDNLNQVINFINNRYIEWELCKGSLLGHAAAVTWKGRGIALAGFAGAGKSTLSLHMMSRGTDFVSNDRLMINLDNNQLMMRGVAKQPRINPGTILNNDDLTPLLSNGERKEFQSLESRELWKLEHKFDVPIEQCFKNSKFHLKAPMSILAILNWKRECGDLTIQEVNLAERRDLLPAFMKSTGLFFLPQNVHHVSPTEEEHYINMLSHCKVIELSGGIDFDAAADACLSAAENEVKNHATAN